MKILFIRNYGCAIVLILLLNGLNLYAQKNESETIERVFNGLSEAVEVAGEKPKRMRLEDRMLDYKIPGLGVALIENGKVRWVRYFGFREVGLPSKIDAATRFKVESLSKPLSAFAALRLVDRNLLDLDSPLRNYLKSWTIPSNEFTARSEPTLRQLLSHSAGFNIFGVPTYQVGEPVPDLLQALNGTAPAKGSPVQIDYEPGTKSRYSGGGYSVLQRLLEDVSGKAFSAFMDDELLRPLGLKQSVFYAGMPTELTAVAAVGHQNNGKAVDGKWKVAIQLAAGGLISTPIDIAKFDIEVMKAWQGKSNLISKSTARAMLTRQKDNWALGFEVKGEGNNVYFSHTGSGDGFRAILVGFPATGQGAVILSNSSSGSELRYELLRTIAREYGWKAFRAIERKAIPLDADRLAMLVGSYEYTDGSVTEVSIRYGHLSARWRDLEPVRLYAATSTLFFSDANEEFEFTEDDSTGKVGLKWRGSFGEFVATRKK